MKRSGAATGSHVSDSVVGAVLVRDLGAVGQQNAAGAHLHRADQRAHDRHCGDADQAARTSVSPGCAQMGRSLALT